MRNLSDYPRRSLEVLREEGPLELSARARTEIHQRISRRYYNLRETNIFDRDWDAALILDACRVDALQAVAPEYDFLPDTIPSTVSVGAGSPRWMADTFTDGYHSKIAETAYVTGNPHSRRVMDPSEEGLHSHYNTETDAISMLGRFEPVYEHAWDADKGTVRGRDITAALVQLNRDGEYDRLIAHYMQPHFPSVPSPTGHTLDIDDEARSTNNIYDRMESGELSVEVVWSAYLDNLRYALDEVSVVLNNLDADRVVITADHGDSFGERELYGHGYGFLGVNRRVPWVTVSATDTGEFQPDAVFESPATETAVDEQLAALGYRETA